MNAPRPATAVVGAGWAGLAAAVAAAQAGHAVTVFEAARLPGGRARALPVQCPDGTAVRLDNGQHILIGAYTECLRLMRLVGVDVHAALLRLPLSLRHADGNGLALPRVPAPLDALAGILGARGWHWRDKAALLRTALAWRRAGFVCDARASVADLCRGLTPRAVAELVEPLCLSALNTPIDEASGQVFLRVLRDAMFGAAGGSRLLLPRVDLGTLFPEAATRWLATRGAAVRLGHRVATVGPHGAGWQVDGAGFDRVVLAVPPGEAVRLLAPHAGHAPAIAAWIAAAQVLRFTAIATVYAQADGGRLRAPLLALHSGADRGPAQFVFDRGQLGGPAGLMAFVASHSRGGADALEPQVLAQAARQLPALHGLRPVRTVVEKRATFASTPGLVRPGRLLAPGLVAAGDYVDGPYPATLEGAVRSGSAAINSQDYTSAAPNSSPLPQHTPGINP